MELLLVLGVLALAVLVGWAVTGARRSGPSREVAVAAARRHGLVLAVLAPLVGLVTVGSLLWGAADIGHGFPGSIGDALAISPLAYALAHTLVMVLGELTWPRPAGAVRRARLVPRRLSDVLPPRLTRVVAAGTVLLVAVLVIGAVLAEPDGRTISHRRGPELSTAGPWPGWHYGEPITVELALLAVLVAVALWVVVNRPAVATEDERIEEALRRTSAHRVLRGAGAPVLLLAATLLSKGAIQLGTVHVLPAPVTNVLVVLADVVGLAGLVVLCLPAPRLPVETPALAAG
jgi:hypothetical protein